MGKGEVPGLISRALYLYWDPLLSTLRLEGMAQSLTMP